MSSEETIKQISNLYADVHDLKVSSKHHTKKIDEAIKHQRDQNGDVSDIKVTVAKINTDITWMKKTLEAQELVSPQEFKTVKSIVYGMVGLILTTVFITIINQVTI